MYPIIMFVCNSIFCRCVHQDCEAVLDNEPPALSDIEATKDLNSDVGESHVSEAEICDNVVDPPIAQR